MATIKITIDKRRISKDNRYPVIFRLTMNQKSTSINAGVKVKLTDWSPKNSIRRTNKNFKKLNQLLVDKQFELEDIMVAKIDEYNPSTVSELKKLMLRNDEPTSMLFATFVSKEIQLLKDQQRFGNASAYLTASNRFIGFAGIDIRLDEINYQSIKQFDGQLVKDGLSINSIGVYMREIRALLNRAIKEDLLQQSEYPFSKYKIRTEKTISRAIKKVDIMSIKQLKLAENTPKWHARNIFLLIFNLIGISFIDLALLKKSSVVDDRVIYRRRKTGKMYSIKLTDSAKKIIELYNDSDSEFLISHLNTDGVSKENERESLKLKLKVCNRYLKQTGKSCGLNIKLTTYVARYSWANIAKQLGYPKDQIAEALGHEYGNNITGIYLDDYGSEIIDKMNMCVTEN